MTRITQRIPPPDYLLDIDFPTAVGAAAEAPATAGRMLLPFRLRLDLRVADGASAQFRVLALLVPFPGIEIPAAAIRGYLMKLDATQAGLAVRLIPLTLQRLALVLGAVLLALLLLRLRGWLGLYALGGVLLWASVQTVVLLRAMDHLLHRTFGEAFPYKRR